MNKSYKKLICSILAVAIIATSAVIMTVKTSTNDYVDTLTDIYEKYDSSLTPEQMQEPFGFNRLIVNDYAGDDYNASVVAYDKENDFAVLQFDDKQSTMDAYNNMITDGLMVEPDAVMQMDEVAQQYAKCDMTPVASEMNQIPQYLNNFNMAYDDVIVAVVDGGFMLNHEYLKDRFYNRGKDFTQDGNADADYEYFIANGASTHSTAISGIIANNTPDNVKILPVKVIPRGSRNTTVSCLVSGINYAVEAGAKVVNVSISGNQGAATFQKVILNAKNKGVSVCVSSGNEGVDIENTYPSSIPEAITVGSVNLDKTYVNFSNYGKELDFVAAGVNILSTVPDENNNSAYVAYNGTSFSAPYVVASIANVLSANSNMSVDDVYSFLLTNVEDLGDFGRDIYFGNGLIKMGNYTFSDDSYMYKIPQGTLDIHKSVNYNENTQPWKLFNSKINTVNVDSTITNIGDYNFYNMASANFNLPTKLKSVGKYAFYGCKKLNEFTFDDGIESIGACAFGNESQGFKINGYRNTPAELYANIENIPFNIIGCKHNFIVECIPPTDTQEGYNLHTCTVCGETQRFPYSKPMLVSSGKCGDNLSYTIYDNGLLKIDGTGDMYDYSQVNIPWLNNASDIKILEIGSGVNSINAFAFYGLNNLVKINNNCPNYVTEDNILYSKDLSELVLYSGGKNESKLNLKPSITLIKPQALVCANKINTILCNSNFSFVDNVLYDSKGDIVLFMPYYSNTSLTIDKPITIKENAMILCSSVDRIFIEHPDAMLENHSIGYKFNGTLVRNDITFYLCDKSFAEDYAVANSFKYNLMTRGYCGENVQWNYDENSKTLTLSGSGDMFSYNNQMDVPWSKFKNIRKLVIGDNVCGLSRYAFYDLTQLNSLTMPLSCKAPVDETTWHNCTNIKDLELTYGTGYMDNYGTSKEQIIYQYTPWYISRKSITNFILNKNVKRIGDFAFSYCNAVRNVKLSNCEKIGKFAFLSCINLNQITIESENTMIEDYSLFSYMNYGPQIYKGSIIYGKVGSTAEVYCKKFGVDFIPIGCEHFVKGIVQNKNNQNIENVNFYVDDVLKAKTNARGEFICPNLSCGVHSYKLVYNDIVLCSGELNIEHTNYKANISVAIGDYVSDGVINTKDYAKAFKNGYSISNIDLGQSFSISPIEFQKYDVQIVPSSTLEIKRRANSTICDITATKNFICEFNITECGFLFGANVPEEFLILENVGLTTGNSGPVRSSEAKIGTSGSRMPYGLSAGVGTFRVKFYVKYNNGVDSFVGYSDCASYTY